VTVGGMVERAEPFISSVKRFWFGTVAETVVRTTVTVRLLALLVLESIHSQKR
jgi:hypothetical protein